MTSPAAERIARDVRAFYDELPFNWRASAEDAADGLRVNALPSACPDLHALLASGEVASVLDVGCGAGWLANTIARHYGIAVAGVDFTPRAIERARDVARALGTDGLATFEVGDFFALEGRERVDLVASVGVLHHTHSAREAFDSIARHVAPGKYVYLGLYHRRGRGAFLAHFREILDRDGEDAAFRRYASLDRVRAADPEHLRSWFRDQVLHPHETSHTLAEVAEWLASAGFRVRSTSVNAFEPFDRVEDLRDAEESQAEIVRRALCDEGRFLPGFFTVLAQHVASGTA